MTVQPLPPEELPAERDRVTFETNRFLAFVVAAASDLGVDIPERQRLELQNPVHDCPAVAITGVEVRLGMPDAPPTGVGQFDHGMTPMWTLQMMCDIVRCAPQPNNDGIVSSAELQAVYEQASMDMAVLIKAVDKRAADKWGRPTVRIQFLGLQGSNYATRATVNVAVH